MQTLTVNATAGTFRLKLLGKMTTPIAWDATAADLSAALNSILNPNNTNPDLPHTDNFAVSKFGNDFVVSFRGTHRTLRLGATDVITSMLAGTIKLATRANGINYYGLDTFNVDLGSGSDTVNVQGTSA